MYGQKRPFRVVPCKLRSSTRTDVSSVPVTFDSTRNLSIPRTAACATPPIAAATHTSSGRECLHPAAQTFSLGDAPASDRQTCRRSPAPTATPQPHSWQSAVAASSPSSPCIHTRTSCRRLQPPETSPGCIHSVRSSPRQWDTSPGCTRCSAFCFAQIVLDGAPASSAAPTDAVRAGDPLLCLCRSRPQVEDRHRCSPRHRRRLCPCRVAAETDATMQLIAQLLAAGGMLGIVTKERVHNHRDLGCNV